MSLNDEVAKLMKEIMAYPRLNSPSVPEKDGFYGVTLGGSNIYWLKFADGHWCHGGGIALGVEDCERTGNDSCYRKSYVDRKSVV